MSIPSPGVSPGSPIALTPATLPEFLLAVAPVRPVYIKGPPGIGKSSLVTDFAAAVGLDCVTLLGSQMLPEDLLGVPRIEDGRTRFCPPARIARDTPYCLFLDELPNASKEVQKALYPLVFEKRIDDYVLPAGSVVIAAGNRAEDAAFVNPLSSALLNRLVVVELRASAREWLDWARRNAVHEQVIRYVEARPDHLWSRPPRSEEPFSTPRSWHALSDAMAAFGDALTDEWVGVLAAGCLSPAHAVQFRAFLRQSRLRYDVAKLLKGDIRWPDAPGDRDVLYFLSQSFRAHLVKELPAEPAGIKPPHRELAHAAKALLRSLAAISLEIAQGVVAADEDDRGIPGWFLAEVVRDLPRLAAQAR